MELGINFRYDSKRRAALILVFDRERLLLKAISVLRKKLQIPYRELGKTKDGLFYVKYKGMLAAYIYWWIHRIFKAESAKEHYPLFKEIFLQDFEGELPYEELLALTNSVETDEQITIGVPSDSTLTWCKRIQRWLPFKTRIASRTGKKKEYFLLLK
jgi:hypothetical protein